MRWHDWVKSLKLTGVDVEIEGGTIVLTKTAETTGKIPRLKLLISDSGSPPLRHYQELD